MKYKYGWNSINTLLKNYQLIYVEFGVWLIGVAAGLRENMHSRE